MRRRNNKIKQAAGRRNGFKGRALLLVLALAGAGCNNLLAQTTPCTDPDNMVGSTGCVSFTYRGQTVNYATVRAADGQIWLQQNLGSENTATAAADSTAYGDLFQWGRWDDGHQLKNSTVNAVTASPNDPTGLGTGNEFFYTGSPAWWNTNATTDTWTAATPAEATATNGCDPCKALGPYWRLPAPEEWQAVVTGESITNVLTAFQSNLKLVTAGSRTSSGGFNFVGVRGYYWSNTPSSTGAKNLYYSNAIVNPTAGNLRASGVSVRCVKILPPQPTGMLIHTENDVYVEILTDDGTLLIQAEILPAGANPEISWSIVNGTGTATISEDGLVTALTNGNVWAKATSVANPAVLDSIEILLANQISLVAAVEVTTENNVAPTIAVNAGTLQLVAEILPANANQTVSWSIVHGTGMATISTGGLVTAQTNGSVWAKAVSAENVTIVDSLEITITNQLVPATDLNIATANNLPAVITVNAGTLQLAATIVPANANQNVSWNIINGTGTASISAGGLVTAQTNGSIWAKAVSAANAAIVDSLQILISGQASAGIENLNDQLHIRMYPNPVADLLRLTTAENHPELLLTVTDLVGRILLTRMLQANALQTVVEINTSGWAPGSYHISLEGLAFSNVQHLIKN
jgi:hypothetical protein